MAVITVVGTVAYLGAEVQFARGTGEDAILRYGMHVTRIDTPTTPRGLRAKYGALWGIPTDTRPLLSTRADPANPVYTWLGEDDLVMCGVTVEFMTPRPGGGDRASARPQTRKPKRKWWR